MSVSEEARWVRQKSEIPDWLHCCTFSCGALNVWCNNHHSFWERCPKNIVHLHFAITGSDWSLTAASFSSTATFLMNCKQTVKTVKATIYHTSKCTSQRLKCLCFWFLLFCSWSAVFLRPLCVEAWPTDGFHLPQKSEFRAMIYATFELKTFQLQARRVRLMLPFESLALLANASR